MINSDYRACLAPWLAAPEALANFLQQRAPSRSPIWRNSSANSNLRSIGSSGGGQIRPCHPTKSSSRLKPLSTLAHPFPDSGCSNRSRCQQSRCGSLNRCRAQAHPKTDRSRGQHRRLRQEAARAPKPEERAQCWAHQNRQINCASLGWHLVQRHGSGNVEIDGAKVIRLGLFSAKTGATAGTGTSGTSGRCPSG